MKSRNVILLSMIVVSLVGSDIRNPFYQEGFVAMASRPRNPQRPMRATNCAQALHRLREAARGSSIIDEAQNKQHLTDALNQVERLCAEEVPQGHSHRKK